MDLNLNEEKQKRLVYLVIVLIVLVIIALFVFSKSFFVKQPSISPGISFGLKEISINFNTLEDSFLQTLEPFEEISFPSEEIEIGRENPFITY
ncbi:MAG: hypothetical protein WBC21_02245 [Minisyncoccales bacterium]